MFRRTGQWLPECGVYWYADSETESNSNEEGSTEASYDELE